MSALTARGEPYRALIEAAASRHGLEPALLAALVAAESAFNPNAYRAEPHIGDASRGLVQMLLRTARGVGYKDFHPSNPAGDPAKNGKPATGMYVPAVNLDLGAKHLAGLVRAKGGDVAAAVSAYNNGNGRRATTPVKGYVLARDTTTGKPIQTRDVKVGEFFNQPYVDKVLRYRDEFRAAWGGAAAGRPLPHCDTCTCTPSSAGR